MSNFKAAVIGKSGSGKTTLLRSMIGERTQKYCIIVDSQGEFDDFQTATNMNEIGNFLQVKKICRFVPPDPLAFTPEDFSLWLRKVHSACSYNDDIKTDRLLLVIDEFAAMVPSMQRNPDVSRIMEVSRRAGLDYLLGFHRPAQLHPEIREQLTLIRAFKTSHPASLKLYEDIAGPEIALQIANAEKFKTVDFQIE